MGLRVKERQAKVQAMPSHFKLKVELRFVLELVEVEIEAELVHRYKPSLL